MSGLDKNRHRNQTVCFRVSPQERCQLEARIMASGIPKGQYYIQSLLHQEIHIVLGKYQSDRLSLEIRRLREAIEGLYSHEESNDITHLLEDCRALLEELAALMRKNPMDTLESNDFIAKRRNQEL